jgi:hypothetical protein
MNTFTIRGEAAVIRWGYRQAVALGSWTLDDGVLTAQIVSVDTFRVSQSPLTLVIGSVTKPITGLQIAGGTLTARLGPQEITDDQPVCST